MAVLLRPPVNSSEDDAVVGRVRGSLAKLLISEAFLQPVMFAIEEAITHLQTTVPGLIFPLSVQDLVHEHRLHLSLSLLE